MLAITLLGTADAAGTPVHGCDCERCQDALRAPWLRRLQSCILIQSEQASILIDMGVSDHMHNLRAVDLDAAFITHLHADHVGGFFSLRWTRRAGGLVTYFPQGAEGVGDGATLLDEPQNLVLQPLPAFDPVTVKDLHVTAAPLQHPQITHGYVVENGAGSAAVLFDTRGLPGATFDWFAARPPDVAIVDSCYAPGKATEGHNGVDEALAILDQIGARRGVLTHIAHHNWRYGDLVRYVSEKVGARVLVAYDGLRLHL